MKKYFIASDIHDDVDALKIFVDYAAAQQADGIWLIGDLQLRPYSKGSLDDYINTGDKEKFIDEKRLHSRDILGQMKEILASSEVQHYLIPGNYDGNLDVTAIFGEKNLHLQTTMIDGVKIVGYGGANELSRHVMILEHLGEMAEFDPKAMYALLEKEKPQIVFSHTPPQGMCDNMFDGTNPGIKELREYIEKYHPKLVISGHIHEAGPNGNNPSNIRGIVCYPHQDQSTIVVNPGNLGRWEILNPRDLSTVKQFPHGTFAEIRLDDDGAPKWLNQYTLSLPNYKVGKVRKIRGGRLL